MFVRQYGNGAQVIAGLHGWSGDHRTFEPLVARMPPGFTLYSPDLPGYGQSPAPWAWTLEACTAEIGALLAGLPAERFTLLGNCSGALLGLLAVPGLVERVERLVLLDPFAFMPGYFRLFLARPFGKYAYYSAFANPLGRWITNRSLAKHRSKTSDLTGSFRRVNHEVSFRYLELLASLGSIERFRAVRVPTDILYGARSFQAIKQSVVLWQALWPHAQVWELAGAGHLPILEATDALSRILFRLPGGDGGAAASGVRLCSAVGASSA
jgi:pimeloyl-ACP methyl ester carboxylesterase